MPHPFGPLRLLADAGTGRGEFARTLPRLRAALDARHLDHEVVMTRPGQAAQEARTALAEGCRYLVAVGGDDTIHEIVNGMFDRMVPLAPDAVLAVVAVGFRADFPRTFGLDRDVDVLARHLATEHVLPIDVGVVRCHVGDAPGERLFVNIAQVGYGAEALRRAARLPAWTGRVGRLVAAWGAIRAGRRPEADVAVAHTETSVPLVEAVVANCQFFGDGMKVAPRALPDDGVFNVQLFTGQRSQVFVLTSKIYRGEHLPDPDIVEYQSPTVEIAPRTPLPVAADGQVLGATPASFSLLPRALRLKI